MYLVGIARHVKLFVCWSETWSWHVKRSFGMISKSRRKLGKNDPL